MPSAQNNRRMQGLAGFSGFSNEYRFPPFNDVGRYQIEISFVLNWFCRCG